MTKSYDVLIVGGGIAGASLAANLSGKLSVALLEQESQPGYHSTGRSAALFSEIYGNAPIRALSRASHAFFFEPPKGFSDVPLVSRRGAIYLARADQGESLREMMALPDVAARTSLLDATQTRGLCPLLREDYAAQSLHEPDAMDIEVDALHRGYLRLFTAAGGQVHVQCSVSRLERADAVWRAHTSKGVFEAAVVVNAAGAWAEQLGQLAGAAPIGLVPRRRTVVLVDGPDATDMAAWPMTIDIDHQFYFKPDAGLLLLSPADEEAMEACDAQPDELDVAIVIDRVQQATSLVVRRVRSKWAGLRSFVDDRSPVVGYDPACAGFFWLAGQGGYGIQTAPAMGRLAAALVQHEPPPADLLETGFALVDVSPERLYPRA